MSLKDKNSQMDEKEKEIQALGDIGQGERLVNAKAKRQVRGGSLAVVLTLPYLRNAESTDNTACIIELILIYEQIPEGAVLYGHPQPRKQALPWLRPVPDGESAAGCAEACAVCTGGFGGGDCEEGVSEYAVGEA